MNSEPDPCGSKAAVLTELLPGKTLAEGKNTFMPDDLLVSIFPEALGCSLGANISLMGSLCRKQDVAGKQ